MKTLIFRYGQTTLTLERLSQLFAIPQTTLIAKNEHSIVSQVGEYAIVEDANLKTKQKDSKAVYRIHQEDTLVVPTGYLYIVTQKANQIKKLVKQFSLQIVERISKKEFFVQLNDPTISPIDFSMQLQGMSSTIKIAEPDLVATMHQCSLIPSDSLMNVQWYLRNDGIDHMNNKNWTFRKRADAKVIEAWELLEEHKGFICSDKITIAVIDKGFDIKHPDFQGKIVGAKDFLNDKNNQFRIELTKDNRGNWVTNADHGTSCAGIACASANGEGIVGVAPHAKFMPIQYNSAAGRDLRRMFRHIMKNDGDVISCSFGNLGVPMDTLTAKTIRDCAKKGRKGKGCVICFATGNDAEMLLNNEIATHPDIIAVGASTSEDTLAPYTNRSINMSVIAPGGYGYSGMMATTDVGFARDPNTGILEPVGKGDLTDPFYRNNAEGTSFACPLVAGVAALILSANPKLKASEVKKIIEETADKIGASSEYDANGHSSKYGFGRINAANAVRKALGLSLKRYQKAAKADVSMVSPFTVNVGITIKDSLRAQEEELFLQYKVPARHAGKTLVIDMDTPVNHDPTKLLAMFIQKDVKPDFISNYMAQAMLNDDLTAQLTVQGVQEGTYFISVRCLQNFQWVKGGGSFELTFRLEEPIFDEINGDPDTAIASINRRDISRVS